MFGHQGRTPHHVPKQASSCPSAPACVSQRVDTNAAKCRCLCYIVAENVGHSRQLQAFVCFWSKGIVRGSVMGWSGFGTCWNIVKAGGIRHGFMSVQQSFGRSFSSRIMSNQTSGSQCWIITMRERCLQHYDWWDCCCNIATSRYCSI